MKKFILFALLTALFAAPALARESDPAARAVGAVPGHVGLVEDLPELSSVVPQYELTFGDGSFRFSFPPGTFSYISLGAKYTDASLTAYDEDGDGLIEGSLPGGAKDRSELSSVGLRMQREDHYIHVTPRKSGETEVVLMKFNGDVHELFIWTDGALDSWGYTHAVHPETGLLCDLNVYFDENGALSEYYYRVDSTYSYFDAANQQKNFMCSSGGVGHYYIVQNDKWFDTASGQAFTPEALEACGGRPDIVDPVMCTPFPILQDESAPQQP